MGGLSGKFSAAALALVLVHPMAGCTAPPPPPSPSPTSLLGADCPKLAPEDLAVKRIPQGTPEESIANVLESYGSWMNAGADLVVGWNGAGSKVADGCLDGLAEQFRIAYSETIFTTHADVAWQDYYAGQERLTAQTLHNAVDAGPDAPAAGGEFEVLKEIDSSATDSGTFLKFDAIYRPGAGMPADPQNWDGLAKPTRWYVELVPFDGNFIINYIEQTAASAY